MESRLSLYEELAEQPLRFADRVRDEALLIESVHAVLIEAFLGVSA